jgi:hypothetical protein
LVEQAWGVQGEWAGFGHHHWLVDADDAAKHLQFVFKAHVVHGPGPEHFPAGFAATLAEEEKVQQLWWEGSFTYAEKYFYDPAELHAYLREPVLARNWEPPRTRRGRFRKGRSTQ